jgi:SAM-dependent methyltransferase
MHSTFAADEAQLTRLVPTSFPAYVCPNCHGSLAIISGELHCQSCGQAYPVRNGIPDFMDGQWHQNANWSLRHARVFDWIAPIYETNLWYPVVMKLAGVKGPSSLPDLLALVDEMTATVSGDVLDVACGPGTFGRHIAHRVQTVSGIDISAGMLKQGCSYAQRECVVNMHFARARVESLPFAQQSFDAGLCCGSLHLFEDTAVALREIGRTLKPGALLVAVTFTSINTRFSRFAQQHGGRLFEVQKLADLLLREGFADYCPRTFGSALILSARKNAPAAAATPTTLRKGEAQ